MSAPSRPATLAALAVLLEERGSRWSCIDRLATRGSQYVWVRCQCGVEREVRRDGLVSGRSRSCGCLSIETATRSMSALHALPRVITPPADRFWRLVSGDSAESCWIWQGALSGGYGCFYLGGRDGKAFKVRAHRWAYEELRAEIPDGLFLDHLCRNKPCVNPWHLEPVTNAVNVRRGRGPELARARFEARTHCKYGHPRTAENTRIEANGGRTCRPCARERWRAKNWPGYVPERDVWGVGPGLVEAEVAGC